MNEESKEQLKKLIDNEKEIKFENSWLIILLLLIFGKDNEGDETNV